MKNNLDMVTMALCKQDEALRKAREAIQAAKDNYELTGEYEYDITPHLDKALAEIDKVLGG